MLQCIQQLRTIYPVALIGVLLLVTPALSQAIDVFQVSPDITITMGAH